MPDYMPSFMVVRKLWDYIVNNFDSTSEEATLINEAYKTIERKDALIEAYRVECNKLDVTIKAVTQHRDALVKSHDLMSQHIKLVGALVEDTLDEMEEM